MIGHIMDFRISPYRGPTFTSARLMSATISLISNCNRGGCGPVERTSRLERSTAPDDVTPVEVP